MIHKTLQIIPSGDYAGFWLMTAAWRADVADPSLLIRESVQPIALALGMAETAGEFRLERPGEAGFVQSATNDPAVARMFMGLGSQVDAASDSPVSAAAPGEPAPRVH